MSMLKWRWLWGDAVAKMMAPVEPPPTETDTMNMKTETSTNSDPKTPDTAPVAAAAKVQIAEPAYPGFSVIGDAVKAALTRGTGTLTHGSLSINVLNDKHIELVESKGRGELVSHGVFSL